MLNLWRLRNPSTPGPKAGEYLMNLTGDNGYEDDNEVAWLIRSQLQL